jgi:hypothetical protein
MSSKLQATQYPDRATAEGQAKGFALLKSLIAQRQGKDLHGIKWEIAKS